MPIVSRHFNLTPTLSLVGSILVCVVLPFFIQAGLRPQGIFEPEAQQTAIASLIALVSGFWLHQSISALPGTRESSAILPSYLASYGVILTVILFIRMDYSRLLLLVGFTCSIAWFYLIYAITQRRQVLVLGVVPGGRLGDFDHLRHVRTRILSLDDGASGLDAVVVDLRHDHSDVWERRLAYFALEGIAVFHCKDLLESLTGRADLEHLSENNLGSLGPLRPFLLAKRIVDRLIALPVLVLCTPLFAIVAIAIKFDSPGPVFFRQDRVGFRGKIFKVVKFRTMHVAHASSGHAERGDFITSPNDLRITRLGQLLRRSRIDELPQVVNVLRGEMSWIGPRPEAVALSEWYDQEIAFYPYRHVVYPGITGWAQVTQGHVADVDDVRMKLQYDFYYIRNFSVWLDLLIIAKTIRTMFSGFGHR